MYHNILKNNMDELDFNKIVQGEDQSAKQKAQEVEAKEKKLTNT